MVFALRIHRRGREERGRKKSIKPSSNSKESREKINVGKEQNTGGQKGDEKKQEERDEGKGKTCVES